MSALSVEILLDRHAVRRWHMRLRERLLLLSPGSVIQFRLTDGANAFPQSLNHLLVLERALQRGGAQRLSDPQPASSLPLSSNRLPSVILDCTGRTAPAPASGEARVLRPLYDGAPPETAAAAALMAGAAPALAIEDMKSGAIVAAGLPSLEAADGLTGGLETVASRVIALIEKALLSPPQTQAPAERNAPRANRGATAFFLRNLAHDCARRIYHLTCHSPHWRIGWRWNDGPGVLESGSLAGPAWRVLPDLGDAFAADPFPIVWRDRTFIFFERLDYRTNKGVIAAQEMGADGPIGPPLPALEEPWHLSYPFLIAHDDQLYMIPEASTSGAIAIYRCVEFPQKWSRVGELARGIEAADATIFQHAGQYWMTSIVRDGVGGYSDTLAIHFAPDLFGPWREHAQRPVFIDSRYARPAGNVVARDGALWRAVQDCSTGYGKRLAIARIDQLDAQTFRQTITASISPGPLWPGNRLHTLNRAGRLECIDGAILTPKFQPLRRLTQAAGLN